MVKRDSFLMMSDLMCCRILSFINFKIVSFVSSKIKAFTNNMLRYVKSKINFNNLVVVTLFKNEISNL